MQILLNSQVHESIVEYINGDEYRSHEEVDSRVSNYEGNPLFIYILSELWPLN